MATHSNLLSKVSDLFETNVRLSTELGELDTRRTELEQQFTTHLASLNVAISYLPAIVNTLLIKDLPPAGKGLMPSFKHAVLSSLFPQSTRATLVTIEKRISDIRAIDVVLRNSEQRAKNDAYKAADLASQSAVQSAQSITILHLVSDERSKADTQLSHCNLKIKQATESIERNRMISNQMSAQASHHDNEASEFNDLAKYTWFIPGVNLITLPVALIGSNKHETKASECRAIEFASRAEIQENESQKHVLEQEMPQLDSALQELREAINRCSSSEKQALQCKDQAKDFLDQNGIITDRLKQVIRSLDLVQSDVISDPLSWDSLRYDALQSVLDMMTELYEGGFLQGYNHGLLNRLKLLEIPRTQILSMEWE